MNAQHASQNMLDLIGNTPVIPLGSLCPEPSAELFAKYEACNPSFSIKDRIAKAMIEDAEKKKCLTEGMTVVDATLGNTGIALALVCAVKGYEIIIFMPEDASLERRKMFESLGAQLVTTPSSEGLEGAQKRAEEYMQTHKNAFSPHQFDNPANIGAHRSTTAEEILKDFPQGIDALVCGVGTGGTIMGVGPALKEKFPQIQIIAVEPKRSPVLSGGKAGRHRIQQLGPGFVPPNVDPSFFDEIILVDDTDAFNTTQQLAKKAGILVGISSGANVFAACEVAKKLGVQKKVLTFLCDAGQRYFSLEQFFEQDLLRS